MVEPDMQFEAGKPAHAGLSLAAGPAKTLCLAMRWLWQTGSGVLSM